MINPPPELTLSARLARAITLGGPISLAQFMATANTAYYAIRDPLGAAGDFITAPEISQMFGELIGLWLADLSARAGNPPESPKPHYVELGPGRGTLAVDALRAGAKAGFTPSVHFVETSPTLRAAQATALSAVLADAHWHDDISTLPTDAPLLVVANEFFDALPVHQLVKGADGWHQRLVACQDELFLPIAGKRVPDDVIPADLRAAPLGAVIETCPLAVQIVADLAARIAHQGGALLIIDYGYEGPAIGDTLQAVRAHKYANPYEAVGAQDLTCHVDFATLAAAGARAGLRVSALADQGAWLNALGIKARAEALIAGAGGRVEATVADSVAAALHRLTAPDQMGTLFKVMALVSEDWPEAAGF